MAAALNAASCDETFIAASDLTMTTSYRYICIATFVVILIQAIPLYSITKADQAILPKVYKSEPRELGLSELERARPYARFFTESPRPIQTHILDALIAGPQPAPLAYEVDEVASRLSKQGYERMENGWATTDLGTMVVSCLTDMPGVGVSSFSVQ